MRAKYPELFAAIGTIYGSGDGSTTFNVPNLQTRVPVGKGDGYELGDVGGEAEHTLTVDEMPKHEHIVNQPYSSSEARPFGVTTKSDFTKDYTVIDGTTKYLNTTISITASGSNTNAVYPVITGRTGSNTAHNNMQPYTVVNYIIATGKDTGVSVADIITGVQALPLGIEYGGTGTTNIEDIHKNLHIRANAVNLLDNSDFTNPINQRGNSSYTGSGYGIDRWMSSGGAGVVTVKSGCVNIKSKDGSGAYIFQRIESGKIKSGEKYTIVCELADGSIWLKSGEASTSMANVIRYMSEGGVEVGAVRFTYDTNNNLYQVMFSTSSMVGMNVVNVALYEGEYTAETLPKYQPKGYGVELLECQRYFYANRTIWATYPGYKSSGYLVFYIYLPTAMRAKPTFSMERMYCRGTLANETSEREVSFARIIYEFDNLVRVEVTETDTAFSKNQVVIGTFYKAELSADL